MPSSTTTLRACIKHYEPLLGSIDGLIAPNSEPVPL